MAMRTHFDQFAAYNRWANARLYEAALALSDTDYQRDTGVFFKIMSGTRTTYWSQTAIGCGA
jgi:uncharacterized damage-inducible protein DinB